MTPFWAAALAWVMLTIGNFTYQAAGAGDWETAFERSWFQLIAVGVTLWFVTKAMA